MKILIPAALAAVSAVAAVAITAATADASCVHGQEPWTTINRCSAPNQNRGFAQGTGILGTSNRTLTVSLSISGGTKANATGINQLGNIIATCRPSALPGQTINTTAGSCDGGNTHTFSIAF